MTRYRRNDRGHLFRWDAGLGTWLRLSPFEDEYDAALAAIYDADGDEDLDRIDPSRPRLVRGRRTPGRLLAGGAAHIRAERPAATRPRGRVRQPVRVCPATRRERA